MVIFFKVTYSQLTVLFSQNTKVEGCFPSYAWLVGGKQEDFYKNKNKGHTKNAEALILSRHLPILKILILSTVMIYAICKVKQQMKTRGGSEMLQSAHSFTSFSCQLYSILLIHVFNMNITSGFSKKKMQEMTFFNIAQCSC